MGKPRNTKKRMDKMLGVLTLIKKMKGKDARHIPDLLSDESMELLCECIYNSITNLSDDKKREFLKKKLMKDKDKIRFLSKPSNELKKKRALIPQMGSGLGIIASMLIPIVTSLINGSIQSAIKSTEPVANTSSKNE